MPDPLEFLHFGLMNWFALAGRADSPASGRACSTFSCHQAPDAQLPRIHPVQEIHGLSPFPSLIMTIGPENGLANSYV